MFDKKDFKLKIGWLFLLVLSSAFGAPKECVYRSQTLIIALVAQHRGENCDQVVQKGAQQVAALQLAQETVNAASTDMPTLEVRALDTCSTSDVAVKAALKALVQAQQGCKGPLFLGLIGPEDAASLRAITKVISVFHYPLVVMSATKAVSQYNTINVQTLDPEVAAKGIQKLLKELNWSSFYLAFTQDSTVSQTATALLEDDDLCVLQSILPIPTANGHNDFVAYNRLLHALQQGYSSRVVLLVDTAESAEGILKHLESVASKTKFVIYVLGSGLLPWRLPYDLARNTVILQETSDSTVVPTSFQDTLLKSPLWSEYTNQSHCYEECQGPVVRDPTVSDIFHAVHLYQEALRTRLAQKCRPGFGVCAQVAGQSSEDWKTHLEGTILSVKGNNADDVHRIRFHMYIPALVNIYALGDGQAFEEIGHINDGESVVLTKKELLPVETEDVQDQCGEQTYVLPTTSTSTTEGTPVKPELPRIPMDIDILGIDVKLGELSFYEMVAVLTGIVVGMVLAILTMICLVYRCFRVKVVQQYSASNSISGDSPIRRPKKQKKDRRNFLRNSIRSIHTVQE